MLAGQAPEVGHDNQAVGPEQGWATGSSNCDVAQLDPPTPEPEGETVDGRLDAGLARRPGDPVEDAAVPRVRPDQPRHPSGHQQQHRKERHDSRQEDAPRPGTARPRGVGGIDHRPDDTPYPRP